MKPLKLPLLLGALAVAAALLPGPPRPARAHQIGEVVPFFRAEDLTGQPVNLGEYLAVRRVIVFFWDWRRATSTRAMAVLEQIYARYRDRGLTVIGIEGEGSSTDQVAERLGRLRTIGVAPSFTIVPDPGGKVARQFRVDVTPQIFLVDGSGRIVYHVEGFRTGDEIALEDKVRVFLGILEAGAEESRPLPPEAVPGRSSPPTTLAPPDPRQAKLDKLRYFGNYHLNRKEPSKAAGFFREFLQVEPGDVGIWIALGEAYARQGSYEQAREAWETALRIEPGNLEADANIRKLIRGEY